MWDSCSLEGAVVPTHSGGPCLLEGSQAGGVPGALHSPPHSVSMGQPGTLKPWVHLGVSCGAAPGGAPEEKGGEAHTGPLPKPKTWTRPLDEAVVGPCPHLAAPPPALLPQGRNGRDILIIFLPLMGCFLYDAGTPE